ncbi:thermostable hemolysin [Colwellia psychrerythraea]|uniref:Thermostable hemolysin n=1 Tax=Colwellia psychrerythraea TaxID=28229 RepID=A0A099KTV2_COLPS|nr:thermostable hemolysin [Colwellia psychrerythraea]KGJ93986.1 Thermostable hemolysin [Colwellia psychrerythraea]
MINVNSNSHSQTAISLKRNKGNLINKHLNFDIQLASMGSEHRNEIEAFIKQGFAKTYDAKISISTPYLLALSNGSFKAALGIRTGRDDLFLEQYLSGPIEQQAIFIDNKIERQEIVEFSHLFSNAKRFTIPLFMVTAVSLFCRNHKYLVFSGTEKVIKLLDNAGVPTTFIGNADHTKISTSTDDWGNYYSTNPKIMAVSLLEVMSVISEHPLYTRMFQSLDSQIAKICRQLR